MIDRESNSTKGSRIARDPFVVIVGRRKLALEN